MKWVKSVKIPDLSNERESLVIIYATDYQSKLLALKEILSPQELAYSERLRNENQKRTWISCRATLRLILGAYLNKKPFEVELSKGRFGKLYLPESNLFFNVSHSNDTFLLGFCFGGRIGIDIEKLNGSEDLPSMVKYAFSEIEAQYCQYGENPERFAEIWTSKEALLKAAGVGMVDCLSSITVSENVTNDISRYKLKQKSFLCPNRETGSIVYRVNKPIKSIWLTY
ncbi:MAG TPA: 4'-phosphopantetheinyl transferase superfamily protein [Prolixibacteraceae bacterium]|nr:4'-phosphopantetheinyl transferase superfamily protein [Prolixibacteraceae bacterium]